MYSYLMLEIICKLALNSAELPDELSIAPLSWTCVREFLKRTTRNVTVANQILKYRYKKGLLIIPA